MSVDTETPSQSTFPEGPKTGVLFRKTHPWQPRRTVFLYWTTGRGVDLGGMAGSLPAKFTPAQLCKGTDTSVERVILVGKMPPETWHRDQLPEGWTTGAHHLDPKSPTWRFIGPGRRLEVHHVTTWERGGGSGRVTPETLAGAFRLLNAGLAAMFTEGKKPDAPEWAPQLRDTPATTGRELLRRTLPADHEYPALPAEVAALLWETVHQGRYELTAKPGTELPALFGYDRRFAYAHGCGRVRGAGLQSWDRGGAEFVPFAPGRYLIEWQVPDDWAHIGLLQSEDGTWPSTPGEHGRAWADSREVHLAVSNGWDLRIMERILFQDDHSEPFRTWSTKMIRLRDEWLPAQKETPAAVIKLARNIARSIVVSAIGSLQGKGRKITRTADTSKGEEVPPGVLARMESGGLYVWEERAPATGLGHDFMRPEWASQVWAEQRVKLLHSGAKAAQPNVGALHVPRAELVAFNTDAIYTTGDPGWHDTGTAGQFRLKGKPITEPFKCPDTAFAVAALAGA